MNNIDRDQEHRSWLVEVSTGDDALITRETAELAKDAWNAIRDATNNRMPIPAACTGPDGRMLYAWDRGRHHLELEITPEEPAYFFYKNRETGELWGEDYMVGEPLPEMVVDCIGWFIGGGGGEGVNVEVGMPDEKRDKLREHLKWVTEEVTKWPKWKRELLGIIINPKESPKEPRPTPYEIIMAFFDKYGKDVDVYDFRIVSNPPEPTRYQIKARHYKTYEWCPRKEYWWDHDRT